MVWEENFLNPIVHIYGNSTTGKTTAAMLYASFRGTMNALIKTLSALLYGLADGYEKERLARNGLKVYRLRIEYRLFQITLMLNFFF